jgi:hypothetical protein
MLRHRQPPPHILHACGINSRRILAGVVGRRHHQPPSPSAAGTRLTLLLRPRAAGTGQLLFVEGSPDVHFLVEDMPLSRSALARSNRSILQVPPAARCWQY